MAKIKSKDRVIEYSKEFRVLEVDDSLKYRNLRLESLKLHPECFGSDYETQSQLPKLYFERLIEEGSKESAMLGAFMGTELVGICGLTPSGINQVEVIQMYVVEKFRGQCIAQSLLEFGKSYLEKLNCNSMILTVYEENQQAFKLYQKVGFNIINTEKNKVNMLFMTRT